MVIIYVQVVTSPEKVAALEEKLNFVVNGAKAVKGCLAYEWYREPARENRYTIYGEFDSEENFRLYKQSDLVTYIVTQLIPLTTAKPAFKHFRAEIFEQG